MNKHRATEPSTSSHSAANPTKRKKFTTKSPRKNPTKLTLRSILVALALCAWVAFSFYAAAFLASLIFVIIFGNTDLPPFWSMVFELIIYCLDFFILAFLPFLLQKLYLKHSQKNPSEKATTRAARAHNPLDHLKKTGKSLENPADKTSALLEKPTRASLGLSGTPTWTDLGLAPIGFVIYYVGATLLTALLSLFSWFNADEAQSVGFDTNLFGADRLFAFITIVVIAPIAEELIFRGWLYPKLRAHVGIVIAILATSLLFAFLHGQLNVGADVLVLSAVMCLLREFTGTIYAGILLHMLKNALAFILVFVLQIV